MPNAWSRLKALLSPKSQTKCKEIDQALPSLKACNIQNVSSLHGGPPSINWLPNSAELNEKRSARSKFIAGRPPVHDPIFVRPEGVIDDYCGIAENQFVRDEMYS